MRTMPLRRTSLPLLLLALLLGFAAASLEAQGTARLSPEEQTLYELIMAYRRSLSLPPVPLSPCLVYVAQTHVRDLQAHPPTGDCNLHSWSKHGSWTPCCYTPDHARASCMWDKPRELTAYTGDGYEISANATPMVSAELALSSWKSSSGHRSVILNQGIWRDCPWHAVGIGISENYAVIWFGREPDPDR